VVAGTRITVDNTDPANPIVSAAAAPVTSVNGQTGIVSLSAANVGAATSAQGAKADSAVQSIVAGTNVTVNNTDPHNPIVSASGGGGSGIVESIVAGSNVTVDDTDPANPIVSASVTGGGGGIVETIVPGVGVVVDSTDPANPIVSTTGAIVGPHDVWRLYIDATAGSGYVTIAEIELAATPGGADQCSGGTVTADTVYPGSASANAFDNDANTFWSSGSGVPHWIQYTFASPVEVQEVRVQAQPVAAGAPLENPKNFRLEYSPDGGATFYSAMSTTNQSFSYGEIKSYPVFPTLVAGVVEGTGIDVDITTPTLPIVSLNAATITSLGKADTALQTAPVASVAGKTGTVTLVKGDVGLGNADNTSDANKPVSTAQATADALNLKIASNLSDLASASTARTNLGLGNVDNTADASKPVSTAQAAADALNLKIASNLSDLASASTARTNLGLGNVDNTSDASKPVSTAQAAADALNLKIASNLSDLANAGTARTNLGLGNVDNTSDVNKPVSTAQATADALNLKIASNLSDLANAGTARTNLGLGNVTNTSDANKPVSTAQQAALDLKANISPRVQQTTNTATVTLNLDTDDAFVGTAFSGAFTVAAPTGTATQERGFTYRFKDDGTARAITWNAIFVGIGLTLPSTTVAGKVLRVGCKYNTTLSRVEVVAIAQEV
jgi:hypothetical protein